MNTEWPTPAPELGILDQILDPGWLAALVVLSFLLYGLLLVSVWCLTRVVALIRRR